MMGHLDIKVCSVELLTSPLPERAHVTIALAIRSPLQDVVFIQRLDRGKVPVHSKLTLMKTEVKACSHGRL